MMGFMLNVYTCLSAVRVSDCLARTSETQRKVMSRTRTTLASLDSRAEAFSLAYDASPAVYPRTSMNMLTCPARPHRLTACRLEVLPACLHRHAEVDDTVLYGD